jgi:hypothetical protein
MDVLRFRRFGNFATCEGLLHVDGDQLRLDYTVVDGLLGVLKSGVRQVNISLANLASVALAKGWFGAARSCCGP